MSKYSDIFQELEGKLREREAAMKELNLADKKNRVLKAENASLYRKLDEAQTVILSHEAFIENLTEYNARLLQENQQLRQMAGAAVPDGQLSFNLDNFIDTLVKESILANERN